MHPSTSRLLHRGACLFGGVLTGYVLWAAYFQLGLVPSGAAAAVIRAVGRVLPQVGGHSTQWLAIGLAFFVSVAPMAMGIGLAAGAAMMRSPHARWFFYAVPLFPLAAFVFVWKLFAEMDSVAGATALRAPWESWWSNVFVGLLIYVQFFAAAFAAGKLRARLSQR